MFKIIIKGDFVFSIHVNNNGKRYVQPSTEEYITASDIIRERNYRGKRVLRIDAIDTMASKAADYPKYREYLGQDSGEVRLSNERELGKNALISVPRDSGLIDIMTTLTVRI